MSFLSKFGEIILSVFSIIGAIVIGIIRLPTTIRNLDLRRKGPEKIKETVEKIPTEEITDKISNLTQKGEKYIPSEKESELEAELEAELGSEVDSEEISDMIAKAEESEESEEDLEGTIIIKPQKYDSKEKEDTVLKLQIAAGGFLVLAVLFAFNFISFLIFAVLGFIVLAFVYYMLYYRINVMYAQDFNAYRDFFLLYIVVGFVLVLVGGNSALTTAFPFQFLPSISLLIFALIAVAAVFLIFRIRYHRDYTFGEIIELGENTSYVKVDYDIRSNVKPDIYIVQNNAFRPNVGDMVKLEVSGGVFKMNGNKPVKILGKMKGF